MVIDPRIEVRGQKHKKMRDAAIFSMTVPLERKTDNVKHLLMNELDLRLSM